MVMVVVEVEGGGDVAAHSLSSLLLALSLLWLFMVVDVEGG